MAIDPIQLMKLMGTQLSAQGGIRSCNEVPRVQQLMQNFSRKVVSKCIYLSILEATSEDILKSFLVGSGWKLLNCWFAVALQRNNMAFCDKLLTLYLKLPIPHFVTSGVLNLTKNLLSNFCGRDTVPDSLKELSIELLMKWNEIEGIVIRPAPGGQEMNMEQSLGNVRTVTVPVNEIVDLNNDKEDDGEKLGSVTNNEENVKKRRTTKKVEKNKLKSVTKKSSKLSIAEKNLLAKDAFDKYINVQEEYDGTKVYCCKVDQCSFPPTILESIAWKHATLHNSKSKPVKPKESIAHKCTQCDFSCKKKVELNKHWKLIHAVNEKALCSYCAKSFPSKRNLQRHISTVHFPSVEEPVSCHMCEKTFRDQSHLKRHVRSTHTEKRFECNICGKFFVQPAVLRNHMKKSHVNNLDESELNFQCDICEQKFAYNSRLKDHKKQHQKQKTVKVEFVCDDCSKTFSCDANLRRHVRVIHQNLKKLKCEWCDKQFSDNWHKNKHEETNHLKSEAKKIFSFSQPILSDKNINDVNSSPEIDKVKFNFSTPLNAECLLSSLVDAKVKCEICNAIFAKPCFLKDHVKSVHSYELIECKKCDRTFTTKFSFYQHRPCWVKCPFCDQKFSRSCYLKNHMKVHI